MQHESKVIKRGPRYTVLELPNLSEEDVYYDICQICGKSLNLSESRVVVKWPPSTPFAPPTFWHILCTQKIGQEFAEFVSTKKTVPQKTKRHEEPATA